MKFSPEKREKIIAALNQKHISNKCPECGGEMLPNGSEAQQLSFFKDEQGINMNHDYQYLPMFTMSCEKCGFMKHFNLCNLIGKDEAMKL